MCVCVCAKTKVDGNSHTRYYFWVLGVLACLDGYMNIAMEQTEEFVDGQLKAKYGDCFVRGNNGELFTWGRRFYLYTSSYAKGSSSHVCSIDKVLYISTQKRT